MALPDRFHDAAHNHGRYTRPAGIARADLDLNVYDTPELHGYESTIEEAIFILSQSDTARKLAATALAADYTLVLMGADEDPLLKGYVDHDQRLIFLAKQDDPRDVALTLAHELTHVSQKIQGGIDINIHNDHPLHTLKKFMAIEADARAYEFIVAVELSYHRAGADAQRIIFPDMTTRAAEKADNHFLTALLHHVQDRLPDSVATDKLMTAVFKAFYGDIPLRVTYENKLTAALLRTPDDVVQNPTKMSATIDNADLMARLDTHCLCYLSPNKQHIDFNDPRLSAISAQTAERLASVQSRRAAAGDAPWSAPVYSPATTPAAPAAAKKPEPKQ